MEHRDKERLTDMLVYAQRVQTFIANRTQQDLRTDNELVGLAVVRAIEIIGEAANKVSKELQNAHPEIPWRNIIGMRHRLIHDYGNVDYAVVWQVATKNLPALIIQLQLVLNE